MFTVEDGVKTKEGSLVCNGCGKRMYQALKHCTGCKKMLSVQAFPHWKGVPRKRCRGCTNQYERIRLEKRRQQSQSRRKTHGGPRI